MAILIIDIETVPQHASYNALTEQEKLLWDYKSQFIAKGHETPEETYNRAGIYAEFGKAIVISIGWMTQKGEEEKLTVKTFASEDEYILLSAVQEVFTKVDIHTTIVGHNIKEFDIPYLCRRFLINGLKLPDILDVSTKKPWETPFVDTLELWKFGDRKHYVKLDLLASIFGIPSSKDDIAGNQVKDVFYEEQNLERIALYCEKDVIVTSQVFRRLKNLPLLEDKQIETINHV